MVVVCAIFAPMLIVIELLRLHCRMAPRHFSNTKLREDRAEASDIVDD